MNCRNEQNRTARTKTCIICGKEFCHATALCCSTECKRERARRRAKESFVSVREVNPRITKRCAHCGHEFTTNYRSAQRVYCSPKCMKAAGKAMRRVRESNVPALLRKQVNRIAIYERDCWTCQLCGEPVDRNAKAPHPRAATLDHIIPLAKGGWHREDNLQCAHFICNSRKGSSLEIRKNLRPRA